jgi:hypothetical protein
VNRFCTVLENGKRWRGKHSLPRGENPIRNNGADVAELVDARDLKSLDGNVVWVRVPPPAPQKPVGRYIGRDAAESHRPH